MWKKEDKTDVNRMRQMGRGLDKWKEFESNGKKRDKWKEDETDGKKTRQMGE
jgi:hypothetical protein